MRKTSPLLIVGIVAVSLVLLYTGYLFWQKSSSASDVKKLDSEISSLMEKKTQYEHNQVLGAINAKEASESFKLESVKWSDVIKKIRSTIPTSKKEPIVDILSYSGTSGDAISMNVRTNPNSTAPYFDAADLIKAFDASDYFADAFVPSISATTDEQGREVLNFLFSIKYVDFDPLQKTVGDILDESLDAPAVKEVPAAEAPPAVDAPFSNDAAATDEPILR